VRSAYQILLKDEYNIFSNCSEEVYKEVRSTVISSVLATDFGKHFDILGQVRKIGTGLLLFFAHEKQKNLVEVEGCFWRVGL
jgi:hypothetical protein